MTFLDSPMAVNVTDVFRKHRECMDDDAWAIIESGDAVLNFPGLKLVRSVGESKAINRIRGSCIIMAGSGMCTGGRIKHHLATHISRPECTVLIVGYQAFGTLGRDLVEGKRKVRIHGVERQVKARITQIHGFSGHADRAGLLEWVGNLRKPPRRVLVTHGEENAAENLADEIRRKWKCQVDVPEYQSEYELD